VLGLDSPRAYRAFLVAHAEEWHRLDAMCRIPISRFYRDAAVFQALEAVVLPCLARRAIARDARVIRCWSAGCASGEEAYTLSIVWHLSVQPEFPTLDIGILGTDANETMLHRANDASYASGSVKELPARYRERAFAIRENQYCVRNAIRANVKFKLQDIREDLPAGPFDLVLCRNAVFTYFQPIVQRQTLSRIGSRLTEGAILVIGGHEHLPAGTEGYVPMCGKLPIYRFTECRAAN
jgi:chemotaxis protein methyltransferase CheR